MNEQVDRLAQVVKRRDTVSVELHIEDLYALVGDSHLNQVVVSNLILAASVQLLTRTLDER